MGRSLDASLAYGYDLHDPDDTRIREVTEYGSPNVDWHDPDGEESFADAVIRRLYESIPDAPQVEYDFQRQDVVKERLGVWFVFSGTDEHTGHLLVAGEGPSAYCGAKTVDPAALVQMAAEGGWDAKLAAAVSALGITPTQDGPRWLIFPYYG
jgi:hypothetical protein